MHIPPNWGTFFALIVSFLVFWFIFSRLFFRPFLNLLSERERRFKDLNDRTELLIKQAREAEAEREERLAEVRKGAFARRESERRKAEAEEALEQVRAKIEAELKAAERELEQMGHSLASELAERVLGRPLSGSATETGKNN